MDKFKVGDEVIIITNNDSQEFDEYIGQTKKVVEVDINKDYYRLEGIYAPKNGSYLAWWETDELKLAKPKKTMTETEALKAVLDGKKMQRDMWTNDYLDYIDNHFVIMNANTGKLVYTWEHWCSVTSNISEYIWVERIEPLKLPKFQPKQFVANATGDIGIIVEHTGYSGGIPEYSVRFNGVTSEIKPTLESELSEVVL